MLILLMLLSSAYADVFQLDEVEVVYRNYTAVSPYNRPLLIFPEVAKEGFNLNVNTNILSAAYLDASVESLTNEAQFRSVGLKFNLGVRLTSWLSISYFHWSQHVLERVSSPVSPYPFEGAMQLNIKLYQARPRPSVF